LFYHKKAMIDFKNLVPSKKEKWLKAAVKNLAPITPFKFKFLLEEPRGKEPSFLVGLREKFSRGKVLVPFLGEISIPTQSCLKKGGCVKESRKLTSFSWLVPPALSYLYTRDEGTYRKISSILLGWLEKNPPLRGIGWSGEEEIMARAIVFPILYDALKERISQEKKLLKKLYTSIYQHYLYIREDIQPEGWRKILKSPSLLFSGLFLRKFSMPAPDFDLFLEEFISFVHKETDREGIFKGESLEEHLFFFEVSLYATLLLAKNKYLIGEAWDRLEMAARILMEVRNEEGIPPLGGVKGLYLLPLHLYSRTPDFLVSVFSSFHKSSRVGVEPVEGVEIFTKPVAGKYIPTGFCSTESHLSALHQGDISLVISRMKSHREQAFSAVISRANRPLVYLSGGGRSLSSSGLFFPGAEAELRFLSCTKDGLEAEVIQEEPSSLRVNKEKDGFLLEVELKSPRQALWNTVLWPGTHISIFDDVVELKREETVLKMEIPSGLRMEVDFISDGEGKIFPRFNLRLKTPGKFRLKFS